MITRRSIITLGALLGVNTAVATTNLTTSSKLHGKTLSFSDGKAIHYQAETVDGMLVAEGDILLGSATADPLISHRGSASSISSNKWFDGIVPYQYAEDISNAELISKSQEAITHWNKHSSIRLVERTEANAEQYKDYLEITKGPGCASYVGRIGGKQEIWFSSICSTGSMIHEIGHAIGLLHEHTREDRDQYIVVNTENIIEGKEHNFAIPAVAMDVGEYDYESIMHYGAYFFSKDGNPTISPIQDITGIDLGQRVALSRGDIDAVNRLYATDLSMVLNQPDAIQSGDLVELDIIISNLGEQGANNILVTIPINNSNVLTGFSGDRWNCEQQADEILCGLPTLIEQSSSTLSVKVEIGFESPTEIQANLSSNTWDTDLSNNGLLRDDTDVSDTLFEEPEVHSATTNSTGFDSTEGGGAGALGSFFIFSLMPLFRIRRKSVKFSAQ